MSVIWILPIIALCICGWLVYSSYQNAGVEITISFDDATGIIPGKTQVMSRGIPVGLVKKILPDLDNQQIKAIVQMEQAVADHLVEDTLFWVVRAELSASSVQGLDTILSGSYISIQVGTSTTHRHEFTGLSSAPPVSPDTPGLHLQLRAEALGEREVRLVVIPETLAQLTPDGKVVVVKIKAADYAVPATRQWFAASIRLVVQADIGGCHFSTEKFRSPVMSKENFRLVIGFTEGGRVAGNLPP